MRYLVFLAVYAALACQSHSALLRAEVTTKNYHYLRPVRGAPYFCRVAKGKHSGTLGTISTRRVRLGITQWNKLKVSKERRALAARVRKARAALDLALNTNFGTISSQENNLSKAQRALQNLNDARDVCSNDIFNLPPTPTPAPFCTGANCPNPKVLTYWASHLDSDEVAWQSYLEAVTTLNQIGFTHAGVTLGYNGIDISARVKQLRDRGFKLALRNSSGHIVLNNPVMLDSQNHEQNRQNLKYFNAPNFDPNLCSDECGFGEYGPNCTLKPHRLAHDPAYSGEIWQQELRIVENKLAKTDLGAGDVFLFDTEIWGYTPQQVEFCYPGVLQSSVGRYSGTLSERYSQYYNHWSQRAIDLLNKVKAKSSDIFTLFYNENIPQNINQTWIPPGIGDAPSPRFYFAPNLPLAASSLAAGNFSGTYVWISFSTTSSTWAKAPGSENSNGWILAQWDPVITQKMGLMLKQANVAGIVVYPGPGYPGIPVEYFFRHARALVKGFINGEDPGALLEVCGDQWDNDGDGEFNEGCPVG